MNPRLFSRTAVSTLLSACLAACAVAPRADLIGTSVSPAAASRSIVITPATRSVHVTSGETVRFQVADQEFGWAFHVSPIVSIFDLNRVAPPGVLGHEVLVTISPDPRYHIDGAFSPPGS